MKKMNYDLDNIVKYDFYEEPAVMRPWYQLKHAAPAEAKSSIQA